ncbi:hypothetical protein Poli38472_011834 [Pythium oligandrum]|uniref:Uncharacterized protein n=1 Tax=Pythium oligandrum TaxID=41045 RepID=A0A8K1FDE4_PYTOL|nr:hypothetical protein Poli38472_011834 [Pythium oligandrum]|eukprot:TMW58246.1 hypothetical protein Poli38472_011834 [Pythium oligandrum]
MCFIWEFTIKICIGNMTTTQWTGTYNDLAAALANVDESDFVGMEDYHFAPPPVLVSNTQTMGSTASSDDSEETKMSGPKPEFKRRNRPRDELQNLRATVRQLETRLAILRDQSGKVPEPTQKTDAVADKMWEGIAGRQLRELDRSERENARLRTMVEDQLRTIKSLERMVMKKRSKVTSIIQQPSPSDDVRDPIHDPELDKQIEEEVITMLNDIDRIANDPRFQVSLDNPLHITEVLEDAGDGLVVESLDGRLFPFDYQDTADALWTMWKSVPIDLVHGTAPDNLRFTDSTVWRIDAGELENLGASIQFHSKLIGRRRIEDNRVVMASILLWTSTYNELAAALANVDESDFVGMDGDLFVAPPLPSSDTQTMGSTASSDGSEETATAAKISDETKPGTKRRNRPRDELQNLRATVRQLETRLAILRDQSGKVPEPTQKTDAVADKMWEGIAGRQLRELDRSERENARLRTMVEDQLRTIKSLERMVMKKRSKVTSIIQQPSPSDDVRDPIHDPELDKQIEEEVITMLNDIDRIANDPRFQVSLDNPLHITEVLEDAGDGLVVESLDGRLFPFDYQDTADALWTMWKSVPIDLVHGTAPDNLRFTDSTVWRIDAGELENLGASIQFHSKLIGRRRIEDNRVVMASILLVRPIKLDGTPLSGVHLRLRIWNIFRPINKSEATSFTSRQLYTQCTLERQDGSDGGDSLSGVSLLASFILHNSGPRLELNNQVLENQLIKRFKELQAQDK